MIDILNELNPIHRSVTAKEFSRRSVLVWVSATEASGAATAEEITEAKAASMAQYAPGLPADGG